MTILSNWKLETRRSNPCCAAFYILHKIIVIAI